MSRCDRHTFVIALALAKASFPAIREEKNIAALVTEILGAATAHGQRDA